MTAPRSPVKRRSPGFLPTTCWARLSTRNWGSGTSRRSWPFRRTERHCTRHRCHGLGLRALGGAGSRPGAHAAPPSHPTSDRCRPERARQACIPGRRHPPVRGLAGGSGNVSLRLDARQAYPGGRVDRQPAILYGVGEHHPERSVYLPCAGGCQWEAGKPALHLSMCH